MQYFSYIVAWKNVMFKHHRSLIEYNIKRIWGCILWKFLYSRIPILVVSTLKYIDSMVLLLRLWKIVGSSLGRVKPRTVTFVFATSPLTTDMSIPYWVFLFVFCFALWASTITIQLSLLVKYKAIIIIISLKCNLFSSWYGWNIAPLALNNNHLLCIFSQRSWVNVYDVNCASKYIMHILCFIFQDIEDEIEKNHRDFIHISCMLYNLILLGTLLVVGITLLVVYTVWLWSGNIQPFVPWNKSAMEHGIHIK